MTGYLRVLSPALALAGLLLPTSVGAQEAAEPTFSFGLHCDPVGAVALPFLQDDAADGSLRTAFGEGGPAVRAILEGADTRVAPVDLDGPLQITLWRSGTEPLLDAHVRLEVGAAPLSELLAPRIGVDVTPLGGEVYRLTGAAEHLGDLGDLDLRQVGDTLEVRSAALSGRTLPRISEHLGAPEDLTGGCALAAALDSEGAALLLQLFFPLGPATPGPARLRVNASAPLPEALWGEAHALFPVSTDFTPIATLALTTPVDAQTVAELAAYPWPAPLQKVGAALGKASAIFPEGLQLGPGVAAGVFLRGEERDVLIVSPVAKDPSGRPLSLRRIRRKLRRVFKGDEDSVWISRDVLAIQAGGAPVFLGALPGALLFSSQLGLVDDVRDGGAYPWFDARAPALAERYAVLVLPGPGMSPDLAARVTTTTLGLQIEERGLELVLDGGEAMPTGALVAPGIGPGFVKALETMAFTTRRKEVERITAQLLAAEVASAAEARAYLPKEPWPRAPEDLTMESVPLLLPPGAEVLSLDLPAAAMGVYWVEIPRGGQKMLIHGLIDADGDGEPAHFLRSPADPEGSYLTGGDVY